ncbi:hypothetical protein PVAP13_8NG055600 [Panicum virgatum]|uniref:Uncharacterized protein n=1 Tax=Panicum virgatum TaxID=38727 RepID=A0A8T0P362_PANVG|nr:hypothetical protein PVAP13_8NG055600 [Panicum virgatum]
MSVQQSRQSQYNTRHSDSWTSTRFIDAGHLPPRRLPPRTVTQQNVTQQNGILRRHHSPPAVRAGRGAAAGGRVSLVTRAAALVAAGHPRHAPARRPPQPPRAAPAAAQSREPRRSPPTLVATRAPPALPAAALGPRQPPRATGARAPLSAARATREGAQVSDAMEDGPGVQSGVRGVRESSSVEGRGAGERHRMPHQRGPASGKLPLRAARSSSCLPALLAPHSASCC